MRALELDYLQSRQPGWAGFTLLALALAFAADLGVHQRQLREEIAQKEARLAASARRAPTLPARADGASAEEIAFVRETARRLSTPWDRLFAALEAAHSDRAALLTIEPDAENGTVTLTGEAKDYLAALTYVANLAEQKTLRRVHLVRHEISRSSPQRPVLFTVSAAWKEQR